MGEILDNCKKGGCENCREKDLEYKELIDLLSEMHVANTRDPETLCRAKFHRDFRSDSLNFKKIEVMQGRLFSLAHGSLLPWARNYYQY